MLIDDLKELQHRFGFLPEGELRAYSDRTNTPLYQIQAVVGFYPHFLLEPPPQVEIKVCLDLACHLRGAGELHRRLLEVDRPPEQLQVHPCSCLGQCDAAPAVLVNDVPVRGADTLGIADLAGATLPPIASPRQRTNVDPYPGPSDYAAWRALRSGQNAATGAIGVLKESGLRGMGGAGFPTGTKWELVRGAPGRVKYVVCNADESEPGTFKDRHILENAPHLVLEGMLLAAEVAGAEEAILYLRHEYPGPRVAFAAELERARAAGLLEGGPRVRIFDSPGGYICGEETAMLEALEGKRSEPRNKPPFPGTHGLWGRPTLINNVETFALATAILIRGAEWYKGQGRNGGIGPKFLGLSGDVERPGVYEVPLGLTIREFIDEYGGGMLPGRELYAVSPGGASSGFLPASMADVALEFRALSLAGSMLGSGAVVAIGQGRCMLDLALNLVRFFKNESCGKCVPCRVGSEKLVAMLQSWTRGEGREADLAVLEELAPAMADASICGLGQVAPAPIVSALKYWPDEVLAHVRERRCPAGACPVGDR
ncbi:MAG TPA: NADH-ubiquinone oxidoreductase-F iron-sulfur binding region domain-containing protein [Armatimonadota bacterium]|nr:NADH-ubiquinone oxidoreductase-F iron-sulfur binding region domain-containing protein [Armatimonadota bacterium]